MFQMDLFDLEAVDLQKLTKVIVGHDGKEAGAGWFLNQVIIKESSESKRRYVFKCNRYVLVILFSCCLSVNALYLFQLYHTLLMTKLDFYDMIFSI